MPKHGWKWRADRFRLMSEAELRNFFGQPLPPAWATRFDQLQLMQWALGGERGNRLKRQLRTLSRVERRELLEWKSRHVSPRLAKWIYQRLPEEATTSDADLALRRHLLWLIATHHCKPPWRTAFFWREIQKHKATPYGMEVVGAMSGQVGDIRDVPKLIALYEDVEADPLTRGEALFALAYLTLSGDPAWLGATEDVCRRALSDPELPYARAGACLLAAWTLRFEADIVALKEDQTPVVEGWETVARHACEAHQDYLMTL